MDYEEKKKYLKSYRRAKAQAQILVEAIEELRQNQILRAPANDGMPHGSGGGDLSEYAARLDELEGKLTRKRLEQGNLYIQIMNDIYAMEDSQLRDLLVQRYILSYSWEKIARENGYSEQWAHTLHLRALKIFKIS